MTGITRRQFLNYAVMPGFRPRLQELLFAGFHYIPFFIALVYQTVRLLPAGHPYVNAQNIGRFGIRHVIAEAANHLVLNTRNIDQILLFITILVGLVLVFVQIVMVGISLMFQPVMAGVAMPTNFAGFFLTPTAGGANEQDIALILLDLVFGVPNLFNSCVAVNNPCLDTAGNTIANNVGTSGLRPEGWPFPAHLALHEMFEVYSIGLLVVATFITTYFIITVLLETAQTGTPFGKRFNKVWVPVRIVVAFGLLVPVNYGLNSSQFIVLYAAKFGSGFATNGWNIFNAQLATAFGAGTSNLTPSPVADASNLVAEPTPPEVGAILQFMYVANACGWAEELKNARYVDMWAVRDPAAPNSSIKLVDYSGGPGAIVYETYDNVINWLGGDKTLIIRFGVEDRVANAGLKGFISPLCGEIVLPLTDPRLPGIAEKGPEIMQRYYLFVLQELWGDTFWGNPPAGILSTYTETYPCNTVSHKTQWDSPAPNNLCPTGYQQPLPKEDYRKALQEFYKTDLRNAMTNPAATGLDVPLGSALGAIPEQVLSPTWIRGPILADKGWAGAALWYNKINELNGAVSSAVMSIPMPSKYPEVMERVYEAKRGKDKMLSINRRFEPKMADGKDIPNLSLEDRQMAVPLWEAFNYWQDNGQFSSSTHTTPSANFFVDAINAVLGTSGIYSMVRNPNIHPLAQLSSTGRVLVEAAVRNLGYAVAGGAAGTLFSTLDSMISKMAFAGAQFMITLATISMTAGFVLFYVLPFLPFIYFFFAVSGWIKAIFEAMVGAPLWALAHIRIDGHGLSGQAAVNGYFLIFEIFLRPILIVFGLIASISIFSALVSALNTIWVGVIENVGGFDVESEAKAAKGASKKGEFRGAVDEFFFTVIYAIVVYMMGMSCFKLIDLIPNNILRWMGQSVATENDAKEDAAQSLMSSAQVGSQQGINAIGGGLSGAMKSLAGGG